MTSRRFVFLGHATPQDNAFTLWLGSHLTAAGYEVWFDLKRLRGGETHWNDIEDALRNNTAAYLPIISTASVNRAKRGFHDELAIGVEVLRSGRDNFIIPVRLEAVPAVPPPLVQINWVDFSRGWAKGLEQLREALEKAGVPRRDALDGAAVRAWGDHQASVAKAARAEKRLETLRTNWFPVLALPPRVNLLASPMTRDSWDVLTARLSIPHVKHGDCIVTFASAEAVSDALSLPGTLASPASVLTDDFLAEGSRDPEFRVAPPDARRMVADLCNRSWAAFAVSRGLVAHEMAHGTVWRFAEGFAPDNKAWYPGPNGRRAWRQLVGRKGKLGTLWHIALSARFEMRDPMRLQVRTHVAFGPKGGPLLTDRNKVQRLRKSLCGGWWNDAWRDRLSAAMAFLSEEWPRLRLEVGDQTLEVSAEPLLLTTEWSFDRDPVDDEAAEAEDIEFDEALQAAERQDDGEDDDQ